jgi:hypothetical protein
MTKRTVIKTDLFADEHHQKKITTLDDPLAETASSTDLTAGATEVDDLAPRRVCPQGGCPLCLTETMARILALKRLHHLPPGEQMTYQLPERMSRERFRGLPHGASVSDRAIVLTFEKRTEESGAKVVSGKASVRLLKRRLIARGAQIIDATLTAAPRQRNNQDESRVIEEDTMPVGWKPAQRRRRDVDVTRTRRYDKNHFGHKLSINVDTKHMSIVLNQNGATPPENRVMRR